MTDTYGQCANCVHSVMCAWKKEYKDLKEKIGNFINEEIDYNKFDINLICKYGEQQ